MSRVNWFGIVLWHIGPGSSAVDGFLHPLTGIEHWVTLLMVGMFAARMGRRALWSLPVAVIAGMMVSGVLGRLGIAAPFVEYAVPASVIALGLALLMGQRLPEIGAMIFAVLLGVVHGPAHLTVVAGLRSTQDAIAYVLGFSVAVAGLIVCGILLGVAAQRSERWSPWLRYAGVGAALIGVYLVLRA